MATVTSDPRPFHIRHRFSILLLITLIGAAFRFAALDHPPMWGDEALTYSRVIGSFGELVDILRNDPFVPLHYEVYYWLQHGMPLGSIQLAPHLVLTPSVMRIVPALCGTLMIPAIYFAAIQLCSIRAALVAAAFTSASAYMMAYSHDAKMYVQTWFFITLNLGCIWWWLRTGRTTAWLAWVASGAAAVGFHIAASLIIATQLLFLLTSRDVSWRKGLAMTAGLLLIAAGPAGYYGYFNQWNRQTGGLLPAASSENAAQASQWKDTSGIGWVEDHNSGATGPMLVRGTASAYLIGTEWTDPDSRKQFVSPNVDSIVKWAMLAVLAVLVLAALPWRKPWHASSSLVHVRRDAFEPGWRRLLWISFLLIVPVYGFYYCRSIHHFATPGDWWDTARPSATSPFLWIAVAGIVYFSGNSLRERSKNIAQFLLVATIVIGVCSLLGSFWQQQYAKHWLKMQELYGPTANPESRPDLDWMSLWMPRYVGVIWPAIAIGLGALIARLPTWSLRTAALAVVLGINATNAILHMTAGTWPPHPRMFADVVASRDSHGGTRIILSTLDPMRKGRARWFNASNYGHFGDIGRYYACIYLGLTPTPTEFRNGEVVNQYHDFLGDLIVPGDIAGALESQPSPDRVIIWERWEHQIDNYQEPADLPADDGIVQSLGAKWVLAKPAEIFPLRSWYDWGDMGWMRRREFTRVNARMN